MSGTIELRGLEVSCIIGDRPEERTREQQLLVDIAITCDFTAVVKSDSLVDTIDYVQLAERVRQALRVGKYAMIESAAACVARVCLESERVVTVYVTITKSGCVPGLQAAVVKVKHSRVAGAAHISN